MTIMRSTPENSRKKAVVFPTKLGWMAMATRANAIVVLTFAHTSPAAALAALKEEIADFTILKDEPAPDAGRTSSKPDKWLGGIVKKLQAYASGRRVDFRDLEVDTDAMTDFGRRAILACRKIPYGETATYKALAAKAGNPAAARAVGNHMAANRMPIIIPCHRVLPSGKGLGGFSATGGVEMKRRLLQMEAVQCKRNRQ